MMLEVARREKEGTVPNMILGRQRGFAYIALLIALAVIGAGLGATGTIWHDIQQREKEHDLLFVGTLYRKAIQQYYENSIGVKQYPPTLDSLLLDVRQQGIHRYLRHPYFDPLTESKEWGIIKAPQGGIMGIYSLSKERPIKKANFPLLLREFENQASYQNWKFVYIPQNIVR